MLHVRDSVHDDLDRNRDLLFHFFRGPARPLRNDRHVIVGHVGIGFDRESMERDSSPNEQQHSHGQDQETILKREIDNLPDHLLLRRIYWSVVFWKTRARETTCWPGLIPERITWRPPDSIFPATTSTRWKAPPSAGT